jgi:hypothetical protein
MVSKLIKMFVVFSAVALFAHNASAQATMDSLNQNADQSQGNYNPMNMGYAGFSSLGMTQSAWLDPLQNLGEGQSRPAYSKYYWSPDLVLPIRVREGMITLLNFPEWELVEDIFIGDNATFDGQISGPNTILLYPRKGANVGVDTNIIIFGRSGNRYVFYARSESVNTERLTNSIIDIDVIDGAANGGGAGSVNSGAGRATRGGVGYGSGSLKSGGKSLDSTYTKRMQKTDWLQSIPMDPSDFKFDVEVYVPNPEDVVIAPERVWRDDIFTYIDLGAKSLNMTQRPIVTLIVERIEVPIGFRTKGPNNRLIIVEGIGDMVMRNGKRIICLKMRRSDDVGLDNITYANSSLPSEWDVPGPLPFEGGSPGRGGGMSYNESLNTIDGFSSHPGVMYNGSEIVGRYNPRLGRMVPENSGTFGGSDNSYRSYVAGSPTYPAGGYSPNGDSFDYSKMQRITNNQQYSDPALLNRFSYGSGFSSDGPSTISIELGTDADVEKLESLWDNLSSQYSDVLGHYEPFFSVDAPADGQGKELFHLRVGPVQSLDVGDSVCSKLGRNGIFCSVVRTQ